MDQSLKSHALRALLYLAIALWAIVNVLAAGLSANITCDRLPDRSVDCTLQRTWLGSVPVGAPRTIENVESVREFLPCLGDDGGCPPIPHYRLQFTTEGLKSNRHFHHNETLTEQAAEDLNLFIVDSGDTQIQIDGAGPVNRILAVGGAFLSYIVVLGIAIVAINAYSKRAGTTSSTTPTDDSARKRSNQLLSNAEIQQELIATVSNRTAYWLDDEEQSMTFKVTLKNAGELSVSLSHFTNQTDAVAFNREQRRGKNDPTIRTVNDLGKDAYYQPSDSSIYFVSGQYVVALTYPALGDAEFQLKKLGWLIEQRLSR